MKLADAMLAACVKYKCAPPAALIVGQHGQTRRYYTNLHRHSAGANNTLESKQHKEGMIDINDIASAFNAGERFGLVVGQSERDPTPPPGYRYCLGCAKMVPEREFPREKGIHKGSRCQACQRVYSQRVCVPHQKP